MDRNEALKAFYQFRKTLLDVFNPPIDLLQTLRDIELFIKTEKEKENGKK